MDRFTTKSFVYQLLFWAVYLTLWYFIFQVDAENHPAMLRILMICFGLGQIAQVNTTNYWLIPSLFYKKKYLLFALLVVSMSASWAQIAYWGINSLPGDIDQYTAAYNDWIDIFAPVTVISLFINAMVIAMRVSMDRYKSDRLTEQLVREKMATELKFLKAQINPHFLFNSINTVFHLIDQDAEESKRVLAKFSDILRYHLYQSADEMVPLNTEIDHMRNYLEMEELRRGDILEVDLKVADDIGYVEIAPLILLSFIENAFKHVSTSLQDKNWINVAISNRDGWLVLVIENTVDQAPKKAKHESVGGIGIANIRKRLEVIYGEDYSMSIADNQKTFRVELKIKII